MKDKQLNKDEQLLQDKLNELNFDYQPSDWNALQERLPNSSPTSSWFGSKGIIGIAAVSILTIGAYFMTQNDSDTSPTAQNEIEKVEESRSESTQEEQKITSDQTNKSEEVIVAEQSEKAENKTSPLAEESAEIASNFETTEAAGPQLSENQKSTPVSEPEFKFIGIEGPSEVCALSEFTASFQFEGKIDISWTVIWQINDQIDYKLIPSEADQFDLIGNPEFTSYAVRIEDKKGNTLYSDRKELKVYGEEKIDYTYNDNTDPYIDLQIDLKAEDADASSYEWYNEEGELLGEGQEFSYVFREEGVQDVELRITNQAGCVSKVSKPIAVVTDFDPLAPNAFTPNQDGTNDTFIPVAFTQRDDRFRMEVFNPQGNLVYRGTNKEIGWNGLYMNEGQKMPAGIYIWKVMIGNDKGQEKSFTGKLRLMSDK